MTPIRKKLALLAAGIAVVPLLMIGRVFSSDHADTPEIAADPGTDLTDVFMFPSPTNAANVVLVMTVNPLVPKGQGGSVSFDPNVLYQFKIDNSGDAVEDLVIQATFGAKGANQQVRIAGPARPNNTGTTATALTTTATGALNQPFTSGAMQVFAGAREDPFFFDLEQFFTILPDRATPINGKPVPPEDANKPQATTWRAPGQAKDFLIGFNLLAIVVEVPKSQLIGNGNGNIGLWCTTSK